MVGSIKPYTGGPISSNPPEPDPSYNPASFEEGSRYQQKDIIAVRKTPPNHYLSAQIHQHNILQAPSTAEETQKTSEAEAINEATFGEILTEMKQVLQQEVELFGKALEKSLLESLNKKLKTLKNRLIKKMITDIFEPPEEPKPPENF